MRRLSYAVFGVACTHLVFGAIVRITGSGMGCGPHWPDCDGHLFPPLSRPDLVIEVTHRYLASILLLSLIGLVATAYRRRDDPGVGGRGGVLRMATLALGLGFGAAILGAVTVKLQNSAPATVAHWTVAMSLVAAVTATVIRAGGFGGASARRGGASAKTRRATFAGAGLALAAVVMGGLTAKVQGGSVACLSFPLCGANPAVARGAVHVQSTHRVIAVLLVLHLIGVFFALRKRRETPVVRRATAIALGLAVLQLLVAGAMIGLRLPPVLRSLHEATGVSIWIATFALAYLARLASDDGRPDPAVARRMPVPPAPYLDPRVPDDAAVRLSDAMRFASVSAEPAMRAESRRTPTGSTLAPSMRATAYHRAVMPVAPSAAVTPPGPVQASVTARRSDASIELAAAVDRATQVMVSGALRFQAVGAGLAQRQAETGVCAPTRGADS
jgi:cytochrome c oxidase assembly protein subunit 15